MSDFVSFAKYLAHQGTEYNQAKANAQAAQCANELLQCPEAPVSVAELMHMVCDIAPYEVVSEKAALAALNA
jgi:hypothetical protein